MSIYSRIFGQRMRSLDFSGAQRLKFDEDGMSSKKGYIHALAN